MTANVPSELRKKVIAAIIETCDDQPVKCLEEAADAILTIPEIAEALEVANVPTELAKGLAMEIISGEPRQHVVMKSPPMPDYMGHPVGKCYPECPMYQTQPVAETELVERMREALERIQDHSTERPCMTATEHAERTLDEVQQIARQALSNEERD